MDLRQLQQRTHKIQQEFPNKYSKSDLMLDLVEEVGELAQAILIVEKRKFTNNPAKRRTIKHVANGLADIMFDLLMMAEEYHLDMNDEYLKVIEEVRGRLKKGEFNKYE